MTQLTSCYNHNEKTNIASLSGEANEFPFAFWWKEESKDKKIKEATKSFVRPAESLFYFLQERNCNVVNKETALDFLNNNAMVIDYLYEVPAIIREKFGNVKLSLELYFDPEIEANEGKLFLNIETDFDVKKAREKLEEIDREWFLNRVGEDIRKFNLNLEFI